MQKHGLIYEGTTASDYALQKFSLQGWQAEVVPENCALTPDHVDPLRRFLTEVPEAGLRENEIKYVSRQHLIVVLNKVFPALLLAFFSTALVLVTLGYKQSGSYGFSRPLLGTDGSSKATVVYTKIIAWYLPPLIGVAVCAFALFVAWLRSLQWRFTYIMITNLSLLQIVEPPSSLFFLNSSLKRLDLDKIQSVHFERSWLDKLINAGDLGVQSSDQKQPFDHMPILADPEKVERILHPAYLAAQQRAQSSRRPRHLNPLRFDPRRGR